MGENLDAVEAWLDALDLDPSLEISAGIARTLAAKLDDVSASASGAAAIAMPSITKEFRAVIEEIRDASSDRQEFVTDLFSEVGDSASPDP